MVKLCLWTDHVRNVCIHFVAKKYCRKYNPAMRRLHFGLLGLFLLLGTLTPPAAGVLVLPRFTYERFRFVSMYTVAI